LGSTVPHKSETFERAQIAIIAVFMALGPMGVCYLTTLRRLPATTAAIGALAVPIIGVTTAAILLGEPLGIREVLAMVLTLAGVALALQA
jgi:drug/metabolite transporter (DMT)-like permease